MIDSLLYHRGHIHIIDSTTFEGYGRHVGLGHRVVICIKAHAVLQPCLYIRVKPAVQGAMEEDAQDVHEVHGK